MSMKLLDGSLYHVIGQRRSIRTYSTEPVGEGELNQLSKFAQAIPEMTGSIRIIIVDNKPQSIFKGLIGSYGVIKDAEKYVAFIGPAGLTDAEYELGYYGEQFILRAVSLGLGTCWISGSFKHETVVQKLGLRDGERVYAVTPLGKPAAEESGPHKMIKKMIGSMKRKPLEQISNLSGLAVREEWMQHAAEAMQVAPSARNLQPWYAEFSQKGIRLQCKADGMKIDMGIAMLHLELGANSVGKTGRWSMSVENGCVAEFVLE